VLGEICDDGINDGDGCASDCKGPASGWSCPRASNQTKSICSYCGDGV